MTATSSESQPTTTPAVENCAPIGTGPIGNREAEAAATALKAMADPNRVRIVNVLANSPGDVRVSDITEAMGISQPTVSFHLKKLMTAGLLERRRRGTWAYYTIRRDALERLASIFEMGASSPIE